jgi:hypothetical protein
MANFEKYVRETARSYGAPGATITKLGTIIINAACSVKYLGANTYVELYYDKQSKVIGMKFMAERQPDTFKVQRRTKSQTAFISPRGFLKFYEISYAEKRSFPAEWDEKSQMVVLRLSR